jgi:hypothetical protein
VSLQPDPERKQQQSSAGAAPLDARDEVEPHLDETRLWHETARFHLQCALSTRSDRVLSFARMGVWGLACLALPICFG